MQGARIIQGKDNVATAIVDLERGKELKLVVEDREICVILRQDIASGHKFALSDIPRGSAVYKYGEVIGRATAAIKAGEHVHNHNIESTRGKA